MENENHESLKEEFKVLCKPLNEWMKKKCFPGAVIVISADKARVTGGGMAVSFEVVD
jgi:galactokinase